MAFVAPSSHHLDLYRYWDAKRQRRLAPTRPDIDASEIAHLLRYIALVGLEKGSYRWRLIGGAIVEDMGRNITGTAFGSYVGPSEFVKAMIDTFDQALARNQPLFEESVYEADFGSIHAVSRLILPLAASQKTPQMLMLTRITRHFHQMTQVRDQLKGAKGSIRGRYEIGSLVDLEARIAEWEVSVSGHSPAGFGPEWVMRVSLPNAE